MKAIYKKELRSYFTSFLGYLFIAFLLIIVGIFQYLYNLRYGYANFALAVDGTATFFLLLVPMVTMRILAEEKRQRTDQLIFTAPVSVERIVLGKYLALVTVFGIGVLACARRSFICTARPTTRWHIRRSWHFSFWDAHIWQSECSSRHSRRARCSRRL